jgi:hypothetical protein
MRFLYRITVSENGNTDSVAYEFTACREDATRVARGVLWEHDWTQEDTTSILEELGRL